MGFELSDRQIENMFECGIPVRMQGGIIRYYENGIPPGHFLEAVINNNLKEACARADDENKHILHKYVMWFYCYAPSQSWGYPTAVKDWISKHKLESEYAISKEEV